MTSINVLGVPHAYTLTPAVSSGQTLVFIHGWLLSRQYWQPVISQLSPDCQCLTYDLRGFGNSTQCLHQRQSPPADHSRFYSNASKSPFGLVAYALDLIELLKQLELTQAWLVGHSLGGSIALWAAHLAPELIQGVIGVNVGGGIYLHEAFQRFRSAGQQIVNFRSPWLTRIPFLELAFSRMMVTVPVGKRWGKQRLLDLTLAQSEAALGALLESTTEAEVHLLPQVVASLSQPVYFLAGQQDRVMELKYVHHLASFHALFHQEAGNILEISPCGHLAMVEQPQAVSHHISQVLERHPSRPTRADS